MTSQEAWQQWIFTQVARHVKVKWTNRQEHANDDANVGKYRVRARWHENRARCDTRVWRRWSLYGSAIAAWRVGDRKCAKCDWRRATSVEKWSFILAQSSEFYWNFAHRDIRLGYRTYQPASTSRDYRCGWCCCHGYRGRFATVRLPVHMEGAKIKSSRISIGYLWWTDSTLCEYLSSTWYGPNCLGSRLQHETLGWRFVVYRVVNCASVRLS